MQQTSVPSTLCFVCTRSRFSAASFAKPKLLISTVLLRKWAEEPCSSRNVCARAVPAAKTASSGVTCLETARLDLDAGLKRRITAAALDLKQRGWAVVDDVLPQEDCSAYVDSVWAWLEGLGTGISRSDPRTWAAPHWPPGHRGIINTLEVAHTDFVWRVRKHARIRQVFADLWGDERLLSSFDSINVTPPAAAGSAPMPGGSWLHTDQGPSQKGVACIQGLVNLVDVGPQAGTGTLLVKDGSHLAHERFFHAACTLPPAKRNRLKDWYQFNEEELPFWDAFESVAVSGHAGSLFLWDSRTVHANVVSERAGAWRHVVYCCMQPAALATPGDLARKREAWDGFRITTHWPARNVEFFPDDGGSYFGASADGAPQRKVTAAPRTRHLVEDAVLRRLAGVEPYPAEARSAAREGAASPGPPCCIWSLWNCSTCSTVPNLKDGNDGEHDASH